MLLKAEEAGIEPGMLQRSSSRIALHRAEARNSFRVVGGRHAFLACRAYIPQVAWTNGTTVGRIGRLRDFLGSAVPTHDGPTVRHSEPVAVGLEGSV